MTGNILLYNPNQVNFSGTMKQILEGWYARNNKVAVPADLRGDISYVRADKFQRKHVGAKDNISMFTTKDDAETWAGNMVEISQTNNEIFVAAGIYVLCSAGAAGATAADLDFESVGVTASSTIKNGLLTVELNKRNILEKLPLTNTLSVTEPAAFIPFDNFEVINAGNSARALLEFGANVGDFWIETRLAGWRVGASVK